MATTVTTTLDQGQQNQYFNLIETVLSTVVPGFHPDIGDTNSLETVMPFSRRTVYSRVHHNHAWLDEQDEVSTILVLYLNYRFGTETINDSDGDDNATLTFGVRLQKTAENKPFWEWLLSTKPEMTVEGAKYTGYGIILNDVPPREFSSRIREFFVELTAHIDEWKLSRQTTAPKLFEALFDDVENKLTTTQLSAKIDQFYETIEDEFSSIPGWEVITSNREDEDPLTGKAELSNSEQGIKVLLWTYLLGKRTGLYDEKSVITIGHVSFDRLVSRPAQKRFNSLFHKSKMYTLKVDNKQIHVKTEAYKGFDPTVIISSVEQIIAVVDELPEQQKL